MKILKIIAWLQISFVVILAIVIHRLNHIGVENVTRFWRGIYTFATEYGQTLTVSQLQIWTINMVIVLLPAIFLLLVLKKWKSKWLIYIAVILNVISLLGVVRHKQTQTIAHQIDRLEHGTTAEKMDALYFLGRQHNVYEFVPLFMQHIDDESRETSLAEPTGWLITVSCAVTMELEVMTDFYYDNFEEGNTCGLGENGSERDNEKIKQWWKDWYKNEYPKWLKQNKRLYQ